MAGYEDILLERLEHRPHWYRNVQNTLPCACTVRFKILYNALAVITCDSAQCFSATCTSRRIKLQAWNKAGTEKESKIVPIHAVKAYRGISGIAPPILNFGTR
jgi:hypothetical protein